MGTVYGNDWTFFIITDSVILRRRNVSGKSCRGNQNKYFVFNNFFFENRAFYEIMWKHNVQRGRPQMAIQHMRIAC